MKSRAFIYSMNIYIYNIYRSYTVCHGERNDNRGEQGCEWKPASKRQNRGREKERGGKGRGGEWRGGEQGRGGREGRKGWVGRGKGRDALRVAWEEGTTHTRTHARTHARTRPFSYVPNLVSPVYPLKKASIETSMTW